MENTNPGANGSTPEDPNDGGGHGFTAQNYDYSSSGAKNANKQDYTQNASPHYKHYSTRRNDDNYTNHNNYSNYVSSFYPNKEGGNLHNHQYGNYNKHYKEHNYGTANNSSNVLHYNHYNYGHIHHQNMHNHSNATNHPNPQPYRKNTNSISYFNNQKNHKRSIGNNNPTPINANTNANGSVNTAINNPPVGNNFPSTTTNNVIVNNPIVNQNSKINSNILNSNYKKKKRTLNVKMSAGSNQANINMNVGNMSAIPMSNVNMNMNNLNNMNMNMNMYMINYVNAHNNTNSTLPLTQINNIPHVHTQPHLHTQHLQPANLLLHAHNPHNVNLNNLNNLNNNVPNNFYQQYSQQYAPFKAKKPSAMKKLIFVNSYDKCNDFSNYKTFLTLNLKFLKQSYKFKDNFDGEDNFMNLNMNMNNAGLGIGMGNMNNNFDYNSISGNNNKILTQNAQMAQLAQMAQRSQNAQNINTHNAQNVNSNVKLNPVNNLQNMMNMNLMYMQQMNMNLANFMNNQNNANNGLINVNLQNCNPLLNNNKNNNNMNNYLSLNNQTANTNKESNSSNNPNLSDSEITQGTYFYNPYTYPYSNHIKNNTEVNLPNTNNINNMHNMNMKMNNSKNNNTVQNNMVNYNDSENADFYYESLRLQPYTFVKDPKIIEDNLTSGRYLKGVIRINKCHTHGYITVAGLVNDILIRGNRNLNQSLHLDEVIVELFPMVCWKPLFNKKIRKISLVQQATEDFEKKKTGTSSNDHENTKVKSYNAFNQYDILTGEPYTTDIDKDEDNDLDTKEEMTEINTNPQVNSNNDPYKDLDDEESIALMKYKEHFDTLEERLKYINKVYTLRPEGRIVRILNSPNVEKSQIVRIVNEKSLIFACPIDENLPKIFIKMKKYRRVDFIKKLENDSCFRNKYFLVKIVGWALNFKCPKGIIVNELGNCGDVEVETEVLLRTYEVDYSAEYPQQALDELKQFENWKVDDQILKNRKDLRNEIIFTVDPKHSKDLDDAISVKLIDADTGLLEIGVHIADPSHFVRKDSLLDKEAINRVTTVYMVHKNIPMLPRVLSEDLCSLLPFQDRLAFSCVFRIYFNGALDLNFKPQFFLSIINSAAKWNYELVQRIINGEDLKYEDLSDEDLTKPKSEDIFNQMCEHVRMLHKLTKLVRSQRIQSGSLIIENDEVQFNLDPYTKSPLGFKLKTKTDSNNLIEELMLIANKLTAELLYDNLGSHSLVRKHPFLNDNKFQEIQRYLTLNKLIVDFEDAQALNEMLLKIKNNNYNKFICIQHKLKNFMQRAEYVITGSNDLQDLRHSALNFDLYTHFTSPIRRYPDVVVHRQLKYVIEKLKDAKEEKICSEVEEANNDYTGYDHFIDHFNEKYTNGKMISTKCQKVFHCILLKTQPPSLVHKALVVDINYKNANKNKRMSGGLNNMNNSQNDNTPTLSVNVFIPDLNLEIEWKKEDNPNILNFRYSQSDNSLVLDYQCEDNTVGNKAIRTFDEINVHVSSVDSIPVDIKCSFVLNKLQ